MSEYGITPGPWAIHTGKPIYGFWNIRQDPKDWQGGGYQHICDVPASHKGGYYGDMFAANARAIAEVPAMIEALENLAEFMRRYCVESSGRDLYINEAQAILSRIKGAE